MCCNVKYTLNFEHLVPKKVKYSINNFIPISGTFIFWMYGVNIVNFTFCFLEKPFYTTLTIIILKLCLDLTFYFYWTGVFLNLSQTAQDWPSCTCKSFMYALAQQFAQVVCGWWKQLGSQACKKRHGRKQLSGILIITACSQKAVSVWIWLTKSWVLICLCLLIAKAMDSQQPALAAAAEASNKWLWESVHCNKLGASLPYPHPGTPIFFVLPSPLAPPANVRGHGKQRGWSVCTILI